MANGAAGDLRDDFEIYKTQVAIAGWCGLAIIVVLICGLIYAFFLVRKVRKDFEGRINSLEATRRFTISRPKIYSSSDPTSKLQGEIGKALSLDNRDSKGNGGKSSPLSPISPNHGLYPNQSYPNIHSPGINSVYSNLPSPFPNANPRSPGGNSDRSTNRVESFLNKTRQLYSQSSESSPRLPRTPTNGNGNRDGNIFQFS